MTDQALTQHILTRNPITTIATMTTDTTHQKEDIFLSTLSLLKDEIFLSSTSPTTKRTPIRKTVRQTKQNTRLNECQLEISRLRKDLHASRENLNRVVLSHKTDRQNLVHEIDEKSTVLEKVRNELSAVTGAKEALTSEHAGLSKELKAVSASRDDLSSDLNTKMGDISVLEKSLEETRAVLNKTLDDLAVTTEQKDRAQSQVKTLQDKIKQINVKVQRVSESHEEFFKVKHVIQDYKTCLEKIRVSTLVGMKRNDESITKLRSDMEIVKSDAARAVDEIKEEAEARYDEMEAIYSTNMKRFEEDLEEVQQNLRCAEAESIERRCQIELLQVENNASQEENALFKEKTSEMEELFVKLKNQQTVDSDEIQRHYKSTIENIHIENNILKKRLIDEKVSDEQEGKKIEIKNPVKEVKTLEQEDSVSNKNNITERTEVVDDTAKNVGLAISQSTEGCVMHPHQKNAVEANREEKDAKMVEKDGVQGQSSMNDADEFFSTEADHEGEDVEVVGHDLTQDESVNKYSDEESAAETDQEAEDVEVTRRDCAQDKAIMKDSDGKISAESDQEGEDVEVVENETLEGGLRRPLKKRKTHSEDQTDAPANQPMEV